MIPQDLWKAKALGKELLRQSNAGQDFLGNFTAPSNAGQFHIQESLQDVETLPWGGWEKVKVGLGWEQLGRGLSPQSFCLHGESHSELGEAAESPSSGSCP